MRIHAEKALSLKEQAEKAVEAIERGNCGGGPGVGEKLGEMEESLAQGKAWLEGKGFVEAGACFEESLEVAKWLEEKATAESEAAAPGGGQETKDEVGAETKTESVESALEATATASPVSEVPQATTVREVRQLNGQRLAEAAKMRAWNARQRADAVGGAAEESEAYGEGVARWASAEAAFGEKRFADAETEWTAAAKAFDAARASEGR